MKEQLQYTIGGVNYVMIEYPLTERTNDELLESEILRLGIIAQGVILVKKGGFLEDDLMAAKLLVPENNILEFNRTKFR